ncbi:MAG: trigger factor [Planctomycetaceae bacterium]|nr:trigger factor [Planctomycetaceae bacterium]
MTTQTEDTTAAGDDQQEPEKPKLQMQIKIDKPSACERHVTVSIAREDVERYLKDAYDELGPKAEVPGFRPGRAPRKLVESRFKEHIVEQVKGKLLMDSLTQMGDDQEFSAISEPDFDFDSIQMPDDGPMHFEFDIEVRPEFDLPQWQGLNLERPEHKYTDKEVREHLDKLLVKYATMEDHDGAIEPGYFATLTLRAIHDGQQVSQLTEETIEVKPTLSLADAKVEGFDTLVVGKKPGDTVETKVTISNESENEALRGKEVTLTMEVAAVEMRKLPELTPAFLEKIGGFANEQELLAEVRGELEKQLKFHQQRRVRQQITSLLTVAAKWELPKELLRRQAGREYERMVMELQSSGFTDPMIRQYMNDIQQNALASTAKALKEHFILERIAEDQKIESQPEDFDREVELIAEQSDESPRRVRARLEKRGLMDTLRNQIIERKVIELIESQAEFKTIAFTPQKDEVVAVNYALAGAGTAEIPEAKFQEAAPVPGSPKLPDENK